MVVDELRIANWQRTKDGTKGQRRPKPISPLASNGGITTGKTDLDPDAVIDWLNKLHPGRTERNGY